MQNPNHEPPASSKAPDHVLMDIDVLCISKISLKCHNLDQGSIKGQESYPNLDYDTNPLFKTYWML